LLYLLQTKDNKNVKNRNLAKKILEYLVLHSALVRSTIQNDPEEYALFIQELKHRFPHNRHFAKQVLRSISFCTVLNIPTDDTHKHPLLTGRDFLEIGQHYMVTANKLADKILSKLPVEDDLDDLINKLAIDDEPASLVSVDQTLSTGFLPGYSATCK